MKYKIDHNTPLSAVIAGWPRQSYSRTISIRDTMRDMPPDSFASFLVPVKPHTVEKVKQVRGTISGAFSSLRKEFPERKYVTHHIAAEKGIRVWRLR